MKQRPIIGVIGSGPVGRGLATLLDRADYTVTLGTGHTAAPSLAELPSAVQIGWFSDAAKGEVLFLAVRHRAARSVCEDLRADLEHKLIIDAMNAWIEADYRAAGFEPNETEGQWCARLLPASRIARAFSHIDWDLLVPRAVNQPGTWAAAYAVDTDKDADMAKKLITDIGYAPLYIGTLATSNALDVGGALWPKLETPSDARAILAKGK